MLCFLVPLQAPLQKFSAALVESLARRRVNPPPPCPPPSFPSNAAVVPPCTCLCIAMPFMPRTVHAATYNILGPGVALSCILSRLNKPLRTQILITESTHSRISEHFVMRGVDVVDFAGESMKVCCRFHYAVRVQNTSGENCCGSRPPSGVISPKPMCAHVKAV